MKKITALLLLLCISFPCCGYDGAIINSAFSEKKVEWDCFRSSGSISTVADNGNSMLKIAGGAAVTLNRSVENFKGSFILSLKVKMQQRVLRVYARDYQYLPVLLFEITPDSQQLITYTAKVEGGVCTVNDTQSKKIPLYLTEKGICGLQIEFGSTATDALIDDIRLYGGTEVLNEYQLLSAEEKADVKMKNALVFVCNYYKAAIHGEVMSLQKPIEKDNVLFVPYSDSSPAFTENNIGYSAAQSLGNVFYGDNGLVIISDEKNIFDKSNPDDMKVAAIIAKRVRNIDYYTVDGVLYSLTDSPEGEEIPVKSINATSSDANIAQWAIDDSLGSRWSGADNPSLTLDLGECFDISSLAIAWFNGDVRRAYYSIETSVDGETWNEIIRDAKSSGRSSLYELIPFSAQARYIRYNGKGTDKSEWNSILEFKVFK